MTVTARRRGIGADVDGDRAFDGAEGSTLETGFQAANDTLDTDDVPIDGFSVARGGYTPPAGTTVNGPIFSA